jgi:hypothetical protein
MSNKIKHSDIFKYSKKELLELKQITEKLSQIEKELKSKFNLSVDDLTLINQNVLNKLN